jgi:hypothetical protein
MSSAKTRIAFLARDAVAKATLDGGLTGGLKPAAFTGCAACQVFRAVDSAFFQLSEARCELAHFLNASVTQNLLVIDFYDWAVASAAAPSQIKTNRVVIPTRPFRELRK